jgi:hypothetical protein
MIVAPQTFSNLIEKQHGLLLNDSSSPALCVTTMICECLLDTAQQAIQAVRKISLRVMTGCQNWG